MNQNGIAFKDNEEVWWLETIGGHHWAAVRIPDDSYVVAPNRMNIDEFKFDNDDYMCSDDLKQLIDENHLNPDFEGYESHYNLRHIFGSSSIKDSVYNNPRTWYGQNFLGNVSEDPQNQELPFICEASHKSLSKMLNLSCQVILKIQNMTLMAQQIVQRKENFSVQSESIEITVFIFCKLEIMFLLNSQVYNGLLLVQIHSIMLYHFTQQLMIRQLLIVTRRENMIQQICIG